jgi:hypothetical protein
MIRVKSLIVIRWGPDQPKGPPDETVAGQAPHVGARERSRRGRPVGPSDRVFLGPSDRVFLGPSKRVFIGPAER